jgi:uncharacterized membrane protein YhhN
MKFSSGLFFLLFFAAIIVDLYFISTGQDSMRFFTKPLLMPLLMMAFYAAVRRISLVGKLVLGAAFLSWMGDVLLMFEGHNEIFFIAGLICFLTAHLFYIRYFQKLESLKSSFFRKRPLMLIFIAAYTVELLYLLWPGLGPMKVPVIVYAIVISLMLAAAFWLYGKLPNSISLFFISGAVLFIASDSMLAINKFKNEFANAGLLIMVTYAAAQFCIVYGAVRYNAWTKDDGPQTTDA